MIRFSTSRQTLLWIPDTFFTALLNGRISTLRDETGAIFIDRDPSLFAIILNYLRTKDIDLKNNEIRSVRHEAEFYGITPLVKRLALCEDLNHSSCGDVLFYAFLAAPAMPVNETVNALTTQASNSSSTAGMSRNVNSSNGSGIDAAPVAAAAAPMEPCLPSTSNGLSGSARPGSMVRVPEPSVSSRHSSSHSRNSSWDLRSGRNGSSGNSHSRNPSMDFMRHSHSRNSSADLNKLIRNDVGLVFSPNLSANWMEPMRVQIIKVSF